MTYKPCPQYSRLIVFPQRWRHKYLVIKESITKSCLSYLFTLFFDFLIIITVSILIAIEKKKLRTKEKIKEKEIMEWENQVRTTTN